MPRYYLLLFVLVVVLLAACSEKQAPAFTLPETVTETTKNPLPDLSVAATAGRVLYMVNCSLCHGTDGKSPENSLEANPPDLTSQKIAAEPDGTVFLVIKNGVKKDGKPTMPPAKKLSDQEIWQIVAYVRTLAKK